MLGLLLIYAAFMALTNAAALGYVFYKVAKVYVTLRRENK